MAGQMMEVVWVAFHTLAHRRRRSSRWEYFSSCLVCSTSKTVILRLHVDSYIFWCRENFMLIHKYFDAERMLCWFIHILMQRGFYVDSYMYTTANSLQLAHGRVKSKYLWIFFFSLWVWWVFQLLGSVWHNLARTSYMKSK
jgi:hypothetical protein